MANPAFQAQTDPMTAGSVAYTIDWSDPPSALGLLGLDRGTSANLDLPALLQLLAQPVVNTSQATGAIDIRRVHNVFISSDALANNNANVGQIPSPKTNGRYIASLPFRSRLRLC